MYLCMFPAYFLFLISAIMAADRELVDDIFGDGVEEEFVGFSREELGIHQDVAVEKYNEDGEVQLR